MSSKLLGDNYQIYGACAKRCRFFQEKGRKTQYHGDGHGTADGDDDHGGHVDRDIVFLGFHKVTALLIAHLEHYNPSLVAKLHVIDYHQSIMTELKKRGISCAYGDISSPDVLEHCHHGECRLVISSVSDAFLGGV